MIRLPNPARLALALVTSALLVSSCSPESVVAPAEDRVRTVTVTASVTTIARLGGTVTLTATALDSRNQPITGVPVTWQSSTPAVATVAGGVVTAVSNGDADITATVGDVVSAPVTVTVEQVVASVQVTPTGPVTLASVGATQALSAVARDSGNAVVTGAAITWNSSASAVASVNPAGLVTAASNGTTNITATAGSVTSAAVVVNVAQVPTAIQITPAGPLNYASVGATLQLSARALDALGGEVSGVSVTWASNATGVATVSPSGLLTTVANGTASITATAGTLTSAPLVVNVAQQVTSIELSPNLPFTLTSIGATQALTATGRDLQGGAVGGVSVTWSSSDSSVATVSPAGVVTAVANGVADISASIGTIFSQPVRVTVAQAPGSVSVTPVGPFAFNRLLDTLRLTAVVRDAGGTLMPGASVTWASSDLLVASADTSGLVTANAAGTTAITAVSGTATSNAVTFTVTQPVATVEVTPADSITFTRLAATRTLFAVAKDSGGSAIPGASVVWTSSAPGVASVDAGIVQAEANGTANITATVGTVTSNAVAVTVAQEVTSIEVTPPSPISLTTPGATAQLTAVAKDFGGAVVPGAVVTWVSSAPTVASVSATGLVTPVANGTAEITATFGAVTSNAVPVTIDIVAPVLLQETVTSGAQHSCALTTSGAAYCWGAAEFGRLGIGAIGTLTVRNVPTLVSGGLTFAAISAGDLHTCALTTTGQAYCWGINQFGNLGDGTSTNRFVPTLVSGGLTFARLSVGNQHSCGVTTGGAAYCWGLNSDAQLGDGTFTVRNTPTAVSGGRSYASIDAGTRHTCAVTTVGAAYCWGTGDAGIGDGTLGTRSEPTLVAGGHAFVQVTTGQDVSCGLTTVGTAYCWGVNANGQLGDGSFSPRTTPALVNGGLPFRVVIAGRNHTCGVTTAGAAYCWGVNLSGQLGNGTSTNAATPTVVSGGSSFATIAPGSAHTCAVTTSGSVQCWGANGLGERGDGLGGTVPTPQAVVGGVVFEQIAVGVSHSCGLASGGVGYCWGSSPGLGLGAAQANRPAVTPQPIVGGLSFRSLVAGNQHSCGITTDSLAYCWGSNSLGQLGDGTTIARSMPTLVSGGLKLRAIAAGDVHTCGVSSANAMYCWGSNTSGQVGDGTLTARNVPTLVDAGVAFAAVAAGNFHSCGITTAGAAYCWGVGGNGQIGDGGTSQRLTPTLVAGGLTFASIAVGQFHTCAITVAGAGYCWGAGGSGRIGDGSGPGDKLTPTLVSGGLTFASISTRNASTCAVTTGNAAYCWGRGDSGQLGDGARTDRTVPTLVGVGLTFTAISAGDAHTCGVRSGGAANCWGSAGDGRLGISDWFLPGTVVGALAFSTP